MKSIQEKINCILDILNRFPNEFSEQIKNLNEIENLEGYENFITEITTLLGISHKDLIAEILLCQNTFSPK